MFANHFFEMSQTTGPAVDHFLGLLIVVRVPALPDGGSEGLNSSSAIFLGKPHWCSFQLGADDDDRASGIVHALASRFWRKRGPASLSGVGEAT